MKPNLHHCLATLALLLLLNSFVFSQSTYTGVITDALNSEPLIGVTILIAGTNTGATTGFDGSYTINAQSGDVLQFSYTGYTNYELLLTEQKINNIQLSLDAKLLDEVVVVGYGTVKKSDLTGSVFTVKNEELIKVPSPNAVNALQGKVSGLQILNTSGDPGAVPVVRLRGVTTLNNNNPIAVIDGVITDIEAVSLLNPNDIESMEVLKDASASAIYGSRGAAGVVIVTTKKGLSGENRVSASIERSYESVANRIGVMNGREFATYLNVIEPGTYNNLDVLPDTDWQDQIFQNSTPITNANFSVSGGSEKVSHYFGLGYFKQEGILPKSGLERFTGKLNTAFKLSEKINLGLDVSFAHSDKDNAPNVINTALTAWPINEPFLADGETFAEVNGGNPLAAVEYTNSNTKSLRGLGNLYASINFLNDFTFKTSFQFDLSDAKNRNFTPKFFVGPLQQNDISKLSYGQVNNSTTIYEQTLNYNRDFGKHSFNTVVGYSAQDSRFEFINGSTEGLLRESESFRYLDAGQDEFENVSNNFGRSTLISYLGRVNYSYDSRYLFTASFRRDGSSKFGPENKYGNFPSAAVGWNLSNEEFFSDKSIFNRIKIRGSWGIIGNERIDGNAQYSLIVPGVNGVFGENEQQVPGATFQGGGNPLLKWEETTQVNVGVDLGLLEDKLTIEADYYVKNTDDILVPLEPIGYTGIGSFRSIVYNAANVENKGFEWSVSYRDRKGDFNYRIGVLGTTIQNNVTDIGQDLGADSLLVGGDLGNGQQVARTSVGRPIGYFYGYDVIGVFQDADQIAAEASLFGQSPGDLQYRDINNDGVINTDDRTFIGSSIPNFVYGFNVEVGYKDFTISADFQGQMGNEIYNGKQAVRFTTLNYEDKYNEYWTGAGSTETDPRPSLGGVNFIPSSYYIEDGSFFRLRTLTINYALPSAATQKLKVSGVNIYARATNLFTATNYTGYSPEIGASSAIDGVIDRGVYPITRVITFGINAQFK